MTDFNPKPQNPKTPKPHSELAKIYQRFIKFNDMCLAELKYVLGRRESSAGLFVRGRNKLS